jgi:hypothetical protein
MQLCKLGAAVDPHQPPPLAIIPIPHDPQVAKLMQELRDRKSRAHHGPDEWSAADKQTRACFDFLCGNHTRNLPVVRFNKVNPNPYPYC